MRRAVPLLLPLLIACSGTGGSSDPDKPVAGRTPEDDQKYKEAAARKEVKYGMTRDEVRAAWGAPTRTKRTTYKRRSATCWSYFDGVLYRDVYLDDDGYVIGIESMGG